jgi:DNA invertase Pin-like site-specific DNA recombinase
MKVLNNASQQVPHPALDSGANAKNKPFERAAARQQDLMRQQPSHSSREMMLERQREGIAKAEAEGRYKGRKPIEAERRHSVLKLAPDGVTRAVIATRLGIGEATVYRILANHKALSH